MHAVSLNPLNPTKLAAILQMRKQAWGGPANVWGCTLVEWQSLGLSPGICDSRAHEFLLQQAVTSSFLKILFIYLLVTLHGTWDLNSLTKDRSHAPYSRSEKF